MSVSMSSKYKPVEVKDMAFNVCSAKPILRANESHVVGGKHKMHTPKQHKMLLTSYCSCIFEHISSALLQKEVAPALINFNAKTKKRFIERKQ